MSSIIQGLSQEAYREYPGFSSSQLKSYATSPTPMHFRFKTQKATKALSFGTLAHTACFEPEKLSEYNIITGRRSKHDPEHSIKKEEFDAAKSIADSVRSHPLLEKVLLDLDGLVEESVFFVDAFDHACKARFDFRNPKEKIIFDLKTSQSSDPISRFGGFQKYCQAYRYDIQAAHYLDAVKIATGDDYRFILISVETVFPYVVSLCEFSNETLDNARLEIIKIKRELKQRQASNLWEGWAPVVHTINLNRNYV